MARKREVWLSDVFPGRGNLWTEYSSLKGRELPIVLAAVFDAALAQLLTMRLVDDEEQVGRVLGFEHGAEAAPLGTMGARITMAYLLGIVNKDVADLLRRFAAVRNIFAHRVGASYLDADVQKELRKLYDRMRTVSNRLYDSETSFDASDVLRGQLPSQVEAGEALLLVAHSIVHAYLHIMSSRIQRLGWADEGHPRQQERDAEGYPPSPWGFVGDHP